MLFEDAVKQSLEEIRARLEARAKRGPIGKQHAHLCHAKRFLALWAKRPLDGIGRWEISRWVDQRRTEVADSSVRCELAFLSRVFTRQLEKAQEMMDRGETPAHNLRANPCSLLARGLDKSPIVPKYMARGDQGALEESCDPWTFSVVEFGTLTGLRPLELFVLRPEDVDFEGELLTVRRGKTQTRVIPLNAYALDIARVWTEQEPGEWLFFPKRKNRPAVVEWFRNHKLGPAAREAGIRRVTPRQLRHTFASRLVQQGESLYVVQKLMGHTDPKTTERYAALGQSQLRKAVQKLV